MLKRKFSREFKLAVLQEVDSGKSVAEVCREHDLVADLVSRWRREYKENPKDAFAGKGNAVKEDARNAVLERKIGQQAMEIDFLKRVNANLQSALAESKKNARLKT